MSICMYIIFMKIATLTTSTLNVYCITENEISIMLRIARCVFSS